MAFRYDIGQLSPPQKLPNGTLRVDARLTRTGVFEYRNDDGSVRREYRPPDEVFNEDSLRSFGMVPVTNNHPPVPVTADNAREYMVGAVSESVRRDGDFVVATLTVYDADTIAAIEGGKREISLGYDVRLDATPGEADGQRYDVVQRKIEGNHAAIVDRGRAGPQVRMRMDSATMVAPVTAEKTNMDEIAKENIQLNIALADAKRRADEAEAKLKNETARADKAEGERDAAVARADKAEGERNDTDAFDARVDARVALLSTVARIMGDDFSPKGRTDAQLREAVIVKLGGEKLEGKSDDYVVGRFDSAVAAYDKADNSLANAVESTNNDAAPVVDIEAAAQAKYDAHMAAQNGKA